MFNPLSNAGTTNERLQQFLARSWILRAPCCKPTFILEFSVKLLNIIPKFLIIFTLEFNVHLKQICFILFLLSQCIHCVSLSEEQFFEYTGIISRKVNAFLIAAINPVVLHKNKTVVVVLMSTCHSFRTSIYCRILRFTPDPQLTARFISHN